MNDSTITVTKLLDGRVLLEQRHDIIEVSLSQLEELVALLQTALRPDSEAPVDVHVTGLTKRRL